MAEFDVDLDKKLAAAGVAFKGVQKLPASSLEKITAPVMKSQNVQDFIQNSANAERDLRNSKLFAGVSTTLTTHPKNANIPIALFEVIEQKPTRSVEASVDGRGETVLEGKVVQPGVFGSLNTVTASASYSYFTKGLNAEFFSPNLFFGYPTTLALSRDQESFASYSSYDLSESKLAASVTDKTGHHRFSVETSLQDVIPVLAQKDQPGASQEILASRLRTAKHALKWTHRVSTAATGEDFPYHLAGEATHTSAELAFSGDVAYAKFSQGRARHGAFTVASLHEGESPLLTNPFVWSLKSFAGVVTPLDGDRTPVQERFFAGGISNALTSFRGYRFRRAHAVAQRANTTPETPAAQAYDGVGTDAIGLVSAQVGLPTELGFMPFVWMDAGVFQKKFNVSPTAIRSGSSSAAIAPKLNLGFGLSLPVEMGPITAHLEASYPLLRLGAGNDKYDKPTGVFENLQIGIKLNM